MLAILLDSTRCGNPGWYGASGHSKHNIHPADCHRCPYQHGHPNAPAHGHRYRPAHADEFAHHYAYLHHYSVTYSDAGQPCLP